MQLELRKKLSERGYKISQIGTKSYSQLFGVRPFPEIMFKNMYTEKEKIFYFNQYVSSIAKNESLDAKLNGGVNNNEKNIKNFCYYNCRYYFLSSM